jgi:hypothetical protein
MVRVLVSKAVVNIQRQIIQILEGRRWPKCDFSFTLLQESS